MVIIPQVKLWLERAERRAVNRVMRSGWLTEGPECEAFHDELLDYIKSPYGVFAPNGTLALTLGLLALGIGPGDEVIVPDTTFIASATAVIAVGATPVFCDVKPWTFQFSVENAEKALTPKTRAIMPVHLYGSSPLMDEIGEFAWRHGVFVIEDAAQGMGVRYRGRHAGTFGDVGCFSFYADKTITTGEGGFVVCKDEDVYHRLLVLRNQGRVKSGSFVHPEIGYNYRITDLQAAIGSVQLCKIAMIQHYKLQILRWYEEGLRHGKPIHHEWGTTVVPFRAVYLFGNSRQLMSHLEERGIQTRTFFHPLHSQPCFNQEGSFPNAEWGRNDGVCLPIYPTLKRKEVRRICDAINEFYED